MLRWLSRLPRGQDNQRFDDTETAKSRDAVLSRALSTPHKRHAEMREIMGKLKLTVNEEKTRICKVLKAR
jgi:hypothetical protein